MEKILSKQPRKMPWQARLCENNDEDTGFPNVKRMNVFPEYLRKGLQWHQSEGKG